MITAPILIAEDDLKTSRLVETYLRNDGYSTVIASNGTEALQMFREKCPRLIILDITLPLIDGYQVCTEIRRESNVPVLILSARDQESDCVLGLGLRADDYVVKPFSPRELVARVKALIRRADSHSKVVSPRKLAFRGLVYDIEKRRFILDGESLNLTPLEFTLLLTLLSNPGRVFLRRELLDTLYPNGEFVIDRVIDVHVGKLRQKIGDCPDRPTFIHTVRGIGYRFSDWE